MGVSFDPMDGKVISKTSCFHHVLYEQVAFQSNANHPLAESMGYIKFEGM